MFKDTHDQDNLKNQMLILNDDSTVDEDGDTCSSEYYTGNVYSSSCG
jgi:hypothetical protein